MTSAVSPELLLSASPSATRDFYLFWREIGGKNNYYYYYYYYGVGM